MNNQIDIEDLKNRLAKLFEFIDINNKRIECEKLELETQKDSFWQNQNEAKKTLKKLNNIKKWVDEFDEISIDIEELNILLELNATDNEILTLYEETKIKDYYLTVSTKLFVNRLKPLPFPFNNNQKSQLLTERTD